MTMQFEKTCTECGVTYPAEQEYFYECRSGKYGVSAKCIKCVLKQRKKMYREKILNGNRKT